MTLFKKYLSGLPWWFRGTESGCQCRRHRFAPWSERTPHPTCRGARRPRHSHWACALKSRNHNSWARVLQLLKPPRPELGSATREAPAVKSWCTKLGSSPHSPQPEKGPCNSEVPAQPKMIEWINKFKKKKKKTPFIYCPVQWIKKCNTVFLFPNLTHCSIPNKV